MRRPGHANVNRTPAEQAEAERYVEIMAACVEAGLPLPRLPRTVGGKPERVVARTMRIVPPGGKERYRTWWWAK